MLRPLTAALAAALFALPALAQANDVPGFAEDADTSTYEPVAAAPVLIRRETVLTGPGDRLEGADVLMGGGRISAVGQGRAAPEGAQLVDGTGKWVTPGIIDVPSHLGVYPSPCVRAHSAGNEMTNPVTAHVWAE